MSEHPEDFCQFCQRRNFSWWVDSDRWNVAVAVFGMESGAVLCPSCFVFGHQAATGLGTSWELRPSTPFRWRGPLDEGDTE